MQVTPKMAEPGQKTALVAGATGLVGGHLLTALCASPDYSRVYALSRRPLARDHAKLANRIIRFDQLETQLKGLVCTEAFCCLGTTIAQAGSEAGFRAVDHDLVLAFARAARAAQAQRFSLVSSVGASAGSRHFYLRVKAETEEAVLKLGFPAVDILQPGLLLGSRRETRPLEALAQWTLPVLNPLLLGKWRPYRSIGANKVALAMVAAARSGRRGGYRYTNAGLVQLAAGAAGTTSSSRPSSRSS